MLKVMVLGAGPAGLVAAETAISLGAHVIVCSSGLFGQAVKSELHGCQYLHAPVRGTEGEPVTVTYQVDDAEGYRQKVYGDGWQGKVSPDEYGPERTHQAWDLRKTYENLWSFWGTRVIGMELPIDSWVFGSMLQNPEVDLFVSTIPAPALCRRLGPNEEDNHSFYHSPIWAIGQRSGQSLSDFSFPNVPENTVLCNGTDYVGWYRASRVFGHTTVEWPYREGKKKPPIMGVVLVNKPLKTNCDCWEETGRVVKVGRYGRWEKGYLVHQVVEDVSKAISALQS